MIIVDAVIHCFSSLDDDVEDAKSAEHKHEEHHHEDCASSRALVEGVTLSSVIYATARLAACTHCKVHT